MHRTRYLLALLFLLLPGADRALAQGWTLQVEVDGQPLEGWPLAHDDHNVMLLSRDGSLAHFSPSAAANYTRTSDTFRPYTSGEMRSRLSQEFAGRLVVTGSGHYLVAHPPGEHDLWPARFEELYRSFERYFTVRGMRPERARFPLVAVVFETRNDFIRYAAQEDVRVTPGLLGYYSPRTNRVLMYDFADERGDAAWYVNAETIIHEAAHQAAFNTGIHSRTAMPPKWVVEGLGTLFEARGVWDSAAHATLADRVNRHQLAAFLAYQAGGRPADSLAQLVSSDRAFNTDVQNAYAEAWALTFYLSENEPRRWWQYLERTAQLDPFTEYTPQQRMADFTAVFGNDLRMLDVRMQRFLEDL